MSESQSDHRQSGDPGWKWWLNELQCAIRSPSLKQTEAYGRYCHTLSAAAAIGGVTLLFTESGPVRFVAVRFLALAFLAVVLLLGGVVLSKGE